MLKIQGHRGHMDNYPENTMLAFQKTVESGAWGIETDVRVTADGEFIIIHDATVDRTTDGTGTVSSLTWNYISTLDAGSWFGSQFANRDDCKVITLDVFLDTFKGQNVGLVLHLYVGGTSNIHAVVDKVVAKGMIDQVHIFGDMTTINTAKAYNNSLFTLNSGGLYIDGYQTHLNNAIQHGHNAVSINAGNSLADLTVMVQNIKSYGIMVHTSFLSASYQSGIDKMLAADVDFVLVNNPEISQNYLDSLTPTTTVLVRDNTFTKTAEGLIKLKPYIKTTHGFIGGTSYNATSQ